MRLPAAYQAQCLEAMMHYTKLLSLFVSVDNIAQIMCSAILLEIKLDRIIYVFHCILIFININYDIYKYQFICPDKDSLV